MNGRTLRKVNIEAVLCYLPVRNESLTGDAESNLLTLIMSVGK